MILEFVSTECLRPEIARRSWQSFVDNLEGVDWIRSTLYLNIDPVPAPHGDVERAGMRGLIDEMVSAAESFFGCVEVREAEEANFARAIKWGWKQPRGPAFFHLEADWLLLRRVNIEYLMARLWSGSYCGVNLRAYSHIRDRLCLSPVLLRSDIAARLAMQMVEDVNPEAQLRHPKRRSGGRGLASDLTSFHWPEESGAIVLRDLGRDWLKKQGLQKKGGGNTFVTWERQGHA